MIDDGVEDPYVHSDTSRIISCVGTLFPLDL